MSNSYTRHDLGDGYFRFDLRAAAGASTVFPIVSAVFVGLLAWFIVRPFFPGFALVVAAPAMAWYAYTRVTLYERAKAEQVPGAPAVILNASAKGLSVGPDSSYAVPRHEITAIVWKDWSSDGTDPSSSHALYVDTNDASRIIWNGFDRQTVTSLAGEIATALGGVPVTGDSPLTQAPRQAALTQQQEASARLEKIREGFAQTTITSDVQPMVPGDLVLQETQPGTYELQQVTESGRILHKTIPLTEFSEIFAFAEANADGRNVWLSKLVDKGPAVLMTKAIV